MAHFVSNKLFRFPRNELKYRKYCCAATAIVLYLKINNILFDWDQIPWHSFRYCFFRLFSHITYSYVCTLQECVRGWHRVMSSIENIIRMWMIRWEKKVIYLRMDAITWRKYLFQHIFQSLKLANRIKQLDALKITEILLMACRAQFKCYLFQANNTADTARCLIYAWDVLNNEYIWYKIQSFRFHHHTYHGFFVRCVMDDKSVESLSNDSPIDFVFRYQFNCFAVNINYVSMTSRRLLLKYWTFSYPAKILLYHVKSNENNTSLAFIFNMKFLEVFASIDFQSPPLFVIKDLW